MANLQKKTKAELIMLCNERGAEIEKLNKVVKSTQDKFDTTNRQLQTAMRKVDECNKSLKEKDEAILTQTSEIQKLRKKVAAQGNELVVLEQTNRNSRKQYDDLVYENGVNKSNAAKYKLSTIAFIIAFVIALIFACI